MFNPKLVLLFIFVIAVLLEPILGRGGHSYPKSRGLSGKSHRSGGLSGDRSGSHRSPLKGTLSRRTGTHTNPSAGGRHGNPSPGAKAGNLSSGGIQRRKSSSGVLSGNSHGYPRNKTAVHHVTNNYHYHYSPPQEIAYSPHHGAAPVSYPVYHGTPPTYVYQYKDSGSKYGALLAGLALLNLGTRGVTTYIAGGSHGGGGSRTQYTPQPGEVCKFEVRRDNGDYEQTKIDCQIISSFILQDQAQSHASGTNTTTSVVTVTNTTVMNATNMMPGSPPTASPVPAVGDVLYKMLPNGTLVPVNVTVPGVSVVSGSPANVAQNVTGAVPQNGVMTTSVVTTTTTNTTLVNALDVKGKPVKVTPGMQCFLIHNSRKHNMRKQVPCGLLQIYADKSILTM